MTKNDESKTETIDEVHVRLVYEGKLTNSAFFLEKKKSFIEKIIEYFR